jgi:hypothetical protein
LPETHLESVKDAMFESGGGRLRDYERCAWQVEGRGQFCPLSGADPFLGKVGSIEIVKEFRVEVYCQERYLPNVILAMKSAHPYEEPAYFVFQHVDRY